MKKLFVSCVFAKQLAEKGFDEPCLARYHRIEPSELRVVVGRSDLSWDENKSKFNSVFIESDKKIFPFYSAPLYQQVIDWFREKHGIKICEVPLLENAFAVFMNKDDGSRFCYKIKDTLDLAIEQALELI